MQLYDAFCYALLVIAVAASCSQAENHNRNKKLDVAHKKEGKRISRRDASIFIDNFSIEPLKHSPKVIYRRISSHKYRSLKPKHGPSRTKYPPVKPIRKAMKKYRKSFNPKYSLPNNSKRPPKVRYGPPKRSNYKTKHRYPKVSQTYYAPESAGFGEPPMNFMLDYRYPRPKYGEPTIDSYGAPLKTITHSDFIDSHGFLENSDIEFHDLKPEQGYKSLHYSQSANDIDSNFALSERRPSYFPLKSQYNTHNSQYDLYYSEFDNHNPHYDIHNPQYGPEYEIPSNAEETTGLESYPDVYKQEKKVKQDLYRKRNKPQVVESKTVTNRPKKSSKIKKRIRPDEEVIVGGQYAEPPARYVPKLQPNVPIDSENEEILTAEDFIDPDITMSATISPYVNYKNSNMAFSPQNLNDAFSTVE